MAPFDGPALAAAQIRVKQINAKGGVDGRPARDQDLRHAGQQAGDREGVRRQAASARARTSSSRRATSTSPPRSCRRRSTRACSRSRRASAPTRWARSASARRASSPSASATSRRTKARPWRSTRGARAGRPPRSRRTPSIVYFKDVVAAFKARFKQLGGKIVDQETYQIRSAATTSATPSAVDRRAEADVIVTVDRRCVRRALAAHHGPPDGRQQHADPQLVGR